MQLLHLLAPLLLCTALLWGCEKETEQPPPRSVAVEVVQVEKRDLPETILGIGTVETPETAQIAAKASGQITNIHFRQGQRVERGDQLFTIESEQPYQRLQAQRAALAEAQAQLENARRAYARREGLLTENLISKEVLDEAQTAMETAQARVERIQAEIARLEEELQDTRIVAPIAGTAGDRLVERGDFVDIGDPLVTIVDTRELEVSFSIPERYQGRIRPGQTVSLRTPAWPDRTFTGEIFFVSPRIRPATRDLLIKASVHDPERRLLPGGFVSVEVTVQTHEGALVIPEEALVPTRTGYLVYAVENGEAHRREVRIGLRRPGIVQILEGVQAGETVIREGHMEVSDGTPVTILQEGPGEEGTGGGS